MATKTAKATTKSRPTKKQPPVLPEMPPANANGNYPALETLRVIIARQIIERRHQAGLSQAELAKRAGVREETVSRVEGGKHAPTVRTVEKIDRALSEAENQS